MLGPDMTFSLSSPLVDQAGDQSGPSGLMAGAQSCAVVPVEMLVEEQVIPPVRIGLELLRAAEDRPPPAFVAFEDSDQAVGDAGGEPVQPVGRAMGGVELQQTLDEKVVGGEPDRAAPV